MQENKSPSSKTNFILFVTFYIGWFGCIYAEKFGMGWLSLLFPIISWLILIKGMQLSRTYLLALISLACVGISFDALMNILEHTSFPYSGNTFMPLWLISLWLLFPTSMPMTQNYFHNKLIIASVLGAIFGPLSYKSGEKFGVLIFSAPAALYIYAIFWACFFPVSIVLLKKASFKN